MKRYIASYLILFLGFILLFLPNKTSAQTCSCDPATCQVTLNGCYDLNAICIPYGGACNFNGSEPNCFCPTATPVVTSTSVPTPTVPRVITRTPTPNPRFTPSVGPRQTHTPVPTLPCKGLNQFCHTAGSDADCCTGYTCAANNTCQVPSCQTTGEGCGVNGQQSNCCYGYTCVNYYCQLVPTVPSNSCCQGPFQCQNANQFGSTWYAWNYCVQLQGCDWNCPLPDSPTPIPLRGAAPVFCNPGGNNKGSTNINLGGVTTNIGCIPYSAKPFASSAALWGVGIGGGVAFLVLIYAAFLYLSSAGDPKKVQAAKEMIAALIGGIALIVFGVLFLNYMGVDLLGLQNIGFKQ